MEEHRGERTVELKDRHLGESAQRSLRVGDLAESGQRSLGIGIFGGADREI